MSEELISALSLLKTFLVCEIPGDNTRHSVSRHLRARASCTVMTAQRGLSVGMWWQRPALYPLALSRVLQRSLSLMEAGSPFPRAAHSHRPPGSVRGFPPAPTF